MSELRYYISEDVYCLDIESAMECIEETRGSCAGETISVYIAAGDSKTLLGTVTLTEPHPTALIWK